MRARNEVLEMLEVLSDGKIPATLGSIRLKAVGKLLAYQYVEPHLNNKLLKILIDVFNSKSKHPLPNIF